MKYQGLDVYDITMADADFGVTRTSLVTLPAIESNFLYFGKDNPQFKFANEEKGELVGAIMIPNKLIYRKIGDYQFWVNFTPEVIKKLTGKMISDGTAGLFSVMHKGEVAKGAVEVQEVWIKETENDKSIDFGIEEPIGTSFMKVKVNDDKLKSLIKENGLNGFSIELDASIVEKSELFNKVEEPKKEPSMKITDIFSNSVEANGITLYFSGELAKNSYLVSETEAGKPAPYSGAFSIKGMKYTVENGVVTEAENVELSIDQRLEQLAEKFDALSALAEKNLKTEEEIAAKEAELELLNAQFKKEKAEFAKIKGEKREVTLALSKQMTENQTSGRDWFAKFSNKKVR